MPERMVASPSEPTRSAPYAGRRRIIPVDVIQQASAVLLHNGFARHKPGQQHRPARPVQIGQAGDRPAAPQHERLRLQQNAGGLRHGLRLRLLIHQLALLLGVNGAAPAHNQPRCGEAAQQMPAPVRKNPPVLPDAAPVGTRAKNHHIRVSLSAAQRLDRSKISHIHRRDPLLRLKGGPVHNPAFALKQTSCRPTQKPHADDKDALHTATIPTPASRIKEILFPPASPRKYALGLMPAFPYTPPHEKKRQTRYGR